MRIGVPEPSAEDLLQEHYERLIRLIEFKILQKLPPLVTRGRAMCHADVAAIAAQFVEAHAIVKQGEVPR